MGIEIKKPLNVKEAEKVLEKEPEKEIKELTDREQAEKELYEKYNPDDYDEVIDLEW